MNEVKSAKRVLDILRFFAEEKAPASLARVASALGLPKSSCLALFDTLTTEGYAYQLDGRYYLTGRWAREAQIVAAHDHLAARCRPMLERLQRELNETVILAQLAGDQVVYLDAIEAERVLRFSAHAGQLKPVHASASGRALLSQLPAQQLKELLSTLNYRRYTPATPGNSRELLTAIAQGRERGWHVNLGEHQSDTISIGVPASLHGTVVALVVGAPMARIKDNIDEVGAALARAAAELTTTDSL